MSKYFEGWNPFIFDGKTQYERNVEAVFKGGVFTLTEKEQKMLFCLEYLYDNGMTPEKYADEWNDFNERNEEKNKKDVRWNEDIIKSIQLLTSEKAIIKATDDIKLICESLKTLGVINDINYNKDCGRIRYPCYIAYSGFQRQKLCSVLSSEYVNTSRFRTMVKLIF